jgi:hypothetical protein
MESEDEQDRKLNQKVTLEKLRTPKQEIKKLKTLEELLKEKR